MKLIRKYLYLLQLEEYQSDRFTRWLEKYDINSLEENKGRLKNTWRIKITAVGASILSFFVGLRSAITIVNNFLTNIFWLGQQIIIALAWIKLQFYPKLIKIVITGSYGKTSFKEMLSWVLADKYQVVSTPGNINTNIGIAQTILRKINRGKQIFVVEAGAYRRGEIKQICRLVKPDFGVVTIIGWMHLPRFGSLDNIRKAKLEIVPFIRDKQKLFTPETDHIFIDFEKTIIAIAEQLGIDETKIIKRIKSFEKPDHRLKVTKINNLVTLLDDTYNSNPAGFAKAVDQLAGYKKEQKIIATQGMVDLGEMQHDLNLQAAQTAAKITNIFVIIGSENKQALEDGIKKAKNNKLEVVFLEPKDNLYLSLSKYLNKPTVILHENDLPDNYF